MNNFLNEYFWFNFELNIELNHFLARFNVKMNNQNVSATPTPSPGHFFSVPRRWVSLWDQDTWPPTAQGTFYCPWAVGGAAAVRNALTHRPGHTHSPRTVGGPARWAGVNFPTGINLGQCSSPHMAETSALVTKRPWFNTCGNHNDLTC